MLSSQGHMEGMIYSATPECRQLWEERERSKPDCYSFKVLPVRVGPGWPSGNLDFGWVPNTLTRLTGAKICANNTGAGEHQPSPAGRMKLWYVLGRLCLRDRAQGRRQVSLLDRQHLTCTVPSCCCGKQGRPVWLDNGSWKLAPAFL